MTAVNEMSAYKYTGTGSATSKTSSSSGSSFGDTDAFMGLLLAQMRNQSPLSPMDDNEMISQMAQLNSLQELQSISAAIKELVQSNKFLSTAGLIGKYASFKTLNDNNEVDTAYGKISAVSAEGSDIALTIGDYTVSLLDLMEVGETSLSPETSA